MNDERPACACRSARASVWLVVALVVGSGLGLAIWTLTGRLSPTSDEHYATTVVWKGPYDSAIAAQGTVNCGSSTEIRSQVRRSTTILAVVPEGSQVKAGDVLLELDASSLQEDLNAQELVIANRRSLLAEAENSLAAAKIARTEYQQGLFVAQETLLAADLFAAERGMVTAEAALESAKALHEEAVVSALEVEAAYAGREDADKKVDAAGTALATLRQLTRQKELALLQATIASAEANLLAQQSSLNFDQERLQYLRDQIASCTIRAPASGQVVYANESNSYGSSQSPFVVVPGATVRERQTILWLPNPRDMEVKAYVNEARVTLIRPGMPVTVRVAALGQRVLDGQVVRVSQFAEPSYYSSANIRKYATIIKITNPPADLRIGMNADVQIHVEQLDGALQVPVQAFAESQGRYFSVVKEGDQYETREIEIQSTNDHIAVVEEGLEEGDEVVLNPRSAGELLVLPDLNDPTTQGAAGE